MTVDRELYEMMLDQVAKDDARVGYVPPEAPKPIVDNLKVAWAVTRNPLQGGEYYRATRPAALSSRGFGWHTVVCENLGTMEGTKTHRVAAQAYGSEHVIEPDVLIMRPLGQQGANDTWGLEEIVERCHAAGQKVIADLDDDVWAHEDWTEDTRPTGEQDDKFETWCWKVDGWFASTPYMKSRIEEVGARRGHSPKVVVAPNCYDPIGLGMLSHPSPGRRLGTRLWLSGRMSGDLDIYRECFAPLLEDLDMSFTHIGREWHVTKENEALGQRARNFVDNANMPAHRVFELDSCDVPTLGKLLGRYVNIAAIALADQPFNYAKTETHAVEVASAGLPMVAATSLSIYDKVPGRVYPNPKDVRQRVERLLDPKVWRWESDKARTWAKKVAVRSETIHCRTLQEVVTNLVRA